MGTYVGAGIAGIATMIRRVVRGGVTLMRALWGTNVGATVAAVVVTGVAERRERPLSGNALREIFVCGTNEELAAPAE
jgi:mannitol/fructose-specific phosphotransferase system IIA component